MPVPRMDTKNRQYGLSRWAHAKRGLFDADTNMVARHRDGVLFNTHAMPKRTAYCTLLSNPSERGYLTESQFVAA